MPLFFIVLFIVYLSGNYYVFFRGLQAFSALPLSAKIVLGTIYWLGALSFVSLLKLRDGSISATLGHVLHEIGTGWLVFTLYMVLMLAVIDILKLFHVQYQYSFHGALALTVVLLAYGYGRFQHPEIVVKDIVINKSLTQAKENLKIVAVSDIHIGYGTNKKSLKKYVDLINKQQPDLILIAGDLIDNSVPPLHSQAMHEELLELNAPLGIYMSVGNHEYISGLKECEDFISKTSINLLRDSSVQLLNEIQIVGRDDRHNTSRKPLSELVKNLDLSKPVIVLDHQPYELHHAVNEEVDLHLSGHTHRGQVWPISLITDQIFELSHGYLQKEQTHLYVSSGLSLWGPPFRIGTTSELVVFNVLFK